MNAARVVAKAMTYVHYWIVIPGNAMMTWKQLTGMPTPGEVWYERGRIIFTTTKRDDKDRGNS